MRVDYEAVLRNTPDSVRFHKCYTFDDLVRHTEREVHKAIEACAKIAEEHEPGETGAFMGCGCPQDIAAKIRSEK